VVSKNNKRFDGLVIEVRKLTPVTPDWSPSRRNSRKPGAQPAPDKRHKFM